MTQYHSIVLVISFLPPSSLPGITLPSLSPFLLYFISLHPVLSDLFSPFLATYLFSSYLHERVTLCLDAVHEWSDDGVQFWWKGGEGDKGPCHAAVDAGLHSLVLLL